MWEPGLSGRPIAAIAVFRATPLLLIHRYRSMGIYTTFEGSQFLLWRAGLSNRRTACVGLRSSPEPRR